MRRKSNLNIQNNVTMYGKENQVKKNTGNNHHSGSTGNNNNGGGGIGGFILNNAGSIPRQNWDPGSYDWSKTTF